MNYKLTKSQAKEMLENKLLHFFGIYGECDIRAVLQGCFHDCTRYDGAGQSGAEQKSRRGRNKACVLSFNGIPYGTFIEKHPLQP